jgi:hypothetical protein
VSGCITEQEILMITPLHELSHSKATFAKNVQRRNLREAIEDKLGNPFPEAIYHSFEETRTHMEAFKASTSDAFVAFVIVTPDQKFLLYIVRIEPSSNRLSHISNEKEVQDFIHNAMLDRIQAGIDVGIIPYNSHRARVYVNMGWLDEKGNEPMRVWDHPSGGDVVNPKPTNHIEMT